MRRQRLKSLACLSALDGTRHVKADKHRVPANDGLRSRYLLGGNQVLYQLSYVRIFNLLK